MPRAKKTWAEKMKAKPPHTVKLDQAFAGIPQGAVMLISNPEELAQFLHTVPYGRSLPMPQLRRELAANHGAQSACPVSTSIFLRIVTEFANEQLQARIPVSQLPPVWRVIEPGAPMLKKLSFDTTWITAQREAEGLET